MKAPWVNTILLFVLVIQVVSGYFGMINNEAQFNWILWTHSIGAYAIMSIAYWKGTVIFDAIGRKTIWTRQRVLFMVALLFLFGTLILGLIWTFNGPRYFLRISFVSWHIYLSIPLMGLMLWHAWKMRFVFRFRASKNRAVFVKTAVFAAVGIILWQLANRTKSALALPGAKRRFTGSYPQGLEDGRFPVVSWIADRAPTINPDDFELHITGEVARSKRHKLSEIHNRPHVQQTATLDCTGGWYTVQTWRGVALSDLLADAGISETAVSITVRSTTGYQRRFSLKEANNYILALEMNDEPLSQGHGFPLRLIANDKRGVEWVKWVEEIQINSSSKHWQSPLPLQ